MADENIIITNLQNSDSSKKHYSSLDGMRYINTNIGAGAGGVDIALGAQGLLIQTGTNAPATQDNTIIFDNNFTNSIGDPNNPTTSYTSSLQTIAKLDSLIPAVQIAPNSTTLSINNSIYLNDPSDINTSTTIASYFTTLTNGSGNQIEINNDALQQWVKLKDSSNETGELMFNQLIFSDATSTPQTSYKRNEINYGDNTTFTIKNPSDSYNQGSIILFSDSTSPWLGSIQMNAESYNFAGSYFSFGGSTFSSTGGLNWSTGNSGIRFDSGSSDTIIGDINLSGNNTTLKVDDATSTITLDSRGGISQMGDINNVVNGMKIVINDSAGSINIDNNGDNVITIGDINNGGNATKLVVNDANATFTIAFPTIEFSGTNTTTTSGAHNVDIHSTSSGVSTNQFLQCKLNGNDIWIPYFTTDPSL